MLRRCLNSYLYTRFYGIDTDKKALECAKTQLFPTLHDEQQLMYFKQRDDEEAEIIK